MSADGSVNYAPNAFGFSSAKMDFGIGGVGESKRQKVLFYRDGTVSRNNECSGYCM